MIACAKLLQARAVTGLPIAARGDDLPDIVARSVLEQIGLEDGDVIVVCSKFASRCEGRNVDLSTIEPSARAQELAGEVQRDPRFVELVLRESTSISRKAKGVLVVRHKLGFVVANAGIDASNAKPLDAPDGTGPWVLLLPEAPDATAKAIRERLDSRGHKVGVVISDSFGRPFRLGSVGTAIGVSGLPPLWDRRGDADLFGRKLEQTVTALADQVAAIADLVAGQAAEARPIVVVHGLRYEPSDDPAGALLRAADEDLYA